MSVVNTGICGHMWPCGTPFILLHKGQQNAAMSQWLIYKTTHSINMVSLGKPSIYQWPQNCCCVLYEYNVKLLKETMTYRNYDWHPVSENS